MDSDSEDDIDWEEVQVTAQHEQQEDHLEITIQTRAKPSEKSEKKQTGISHSERLLRIDCHKIHTVALLINAQTRNLWINDPLLHARLLSLTPLLLQTAFAIHKSRIPDPNLRGRMFETAIRNLVEWWSTVFFEVLPHGHIRNRTFDEVQLPLRARDLATDEPLHQEALQDLLDDEGELIRSEKSLMKHALMGCGSRDTSAQLFTALCRALGIPARLVVSLQSVPWQAGVGKLKPKYEKKKADRKGKAKAEEVSSDSPPRSPFTVGGQCLDGEPIAKSAKAIGKEKEKAKPVIKLRKTKSKGHVLGSAGPSRLASPDPTTTPPVFWTEVFSRPDARWLPVDPIRNLVNKRKAFDPSASSLPKDVKVKEENRMLYVVAFEEDGFARDVTRRYAKDFGAKVVKVQGGASSVSRGGKGRETWWASIVSLVTRPYRLHRDDVEDQELDVTQVMEGMPTTMSGFKDHPLYVLTRHLRQNETIHPPPPVTPELGKFRGESVYSRSAVVSLKTAENWMRSEGRTITAGAQPMKMVKMRAGTVGRMRELEVLKDELREAGPSMEGDKNGGANEIMQGLYALSQTELYVPDPIIDGKVPKNNFGNIDLYVPSMLPRGGVHIPFKGVAKVARKLNFDFAEAVTGFEFKKRRAFPIVEGIVVAADHETSILEAYWEAEHDAEERARVKREDRVLKQWTRLVHGLQIRQRLQDQYASQPHEEIAYKVKRTADPDDFEDAEEPKDSSAGDGGFLIGADDVVQAFHLPKYQHVNLPFEPSLVVPDDHREEELEESSSEPPDFTTYDLETTEIDSDPERNQLSFVQGIPKTMRELAEDAAADSSTSKGKEIKTVVTPVPSISIPTSNSFATGALETTVTPAKRKSSRLSVGIRASTRKKQRKIKEDDTDSSDHEKAPSRRKGAAPTPIPIPASTRTLRPRPPKSVT